MSHSIYRQLLKLATSAARNIALRRGLHGSRTRADRREDKATRPRISGNVCAVLLGLALLEMGPWFAPSQAAAQAKYTVQPVAEMKVKQLPKGELYWRVESFSTLDQAKAA